jgi:uncharacterized protein YjiS (DUF1127 family)
MNTTLHSLATTANLPRPVHSQLNDAVNALRAIARSIEARLAARHRAAQDLDALASMSDRELRDIGMNRASTHFVALGGRIRDYPF